MRALLPAEANALIVLLTLICDIFYEDLVEFLSPILVCTNYSDAVLEYSTVDDFDLPLIGKEAECNNTLRTVLFFFTLLFLLFLVAGSTCFFGMQLTKDDDTEF